MSGRKKEKTHNPEKSSLHDFPVLQACFFQVEWVKSPWKIEVLFLLPGYILHLLSYDLNKIT